MKPLSVAALQLCYCALYRGQQSKLPCHSEAVLMQCVGVMMVLMKCT